MSVPDPSRMTGLRNGLFEYKHYQAMGPAVWLFGWLVARQTAQNGSTGTVCGGQPLTYWRIARETGFPAATLRTWMRRLRAMGYVSLEVVREKGEIIGGIVRIKNAKKFQPQQMLLELPKESEVRSNQDGGAAQTERGGAAQTYQRCGSNRTGNSQEERIQDRREEEPPYSPPKGGTCISHPFAQIWQEEHGPLPGIEKLTPSRLRNCQLRARQYTPEQFRQAVIRCRASPFLSGMNDRGWKANFDFLIRNDRNISRVLEGEFDGTAQTKSDRRLTGNLDAARRFLERHGEANHRLADSVRHALPSRPQ